MKITQENVKDLWGLYEIYMQEYKKHCISFKEMTEMLNFEDFVDCEVTQCSQCGEYILEDDLGSSELASQDNICQECMENGYGR